jgi:hypothetical protein
MLAKKPLCSVQREEGPLSHFLMLAFPHYLLQRIQLWCSIHVSEKHFVCILCPSMRAKCLVRLIILHFDRQINPLSAELNPIWHMLVLLGDLTFMGPCIVSIFQYTTKSNKMQCYTVYLYLETALHVSGSISTHLQERIQLYLQHLIFVTLLLLSAAIVEKLEPVWVYCGWRTPHTAHSNRLQLFHDSGR